MSTTRLCLIAVAFAGLACHAASAPSPTVAQSGAFVITLGNDTIAVEQTMRVGDRIEGMVLQHAPRTQLTRYVVTLNPDGTPSLLEFTTRLPDGSVVPNGARNVTVTFTGDSAITQVQRDTLATTRVAAKGAYPFIGSAYSLYALPIAAVRASKADSAALAIYGGGVRATAVNVLRKGENRYWVVVGGYPWEITTDARGQVQTVDGNRTTQHFWAKRQGTVDIAMLSAAWAQRERETRAVGILSPRDTVNATVGSAQLWIDYGRPAARGRKVFGADGVLGDSIWRTGANAATQFRTNVNLTVAGQTVPAGTYTLWMVAIPGKYQLIFNKQTGQWGTEYHADRDLVRVPLQATSLPQFIDRFTIVVEPGAGTTGVLRLRWDTTELTLPFTVP